MNTSTQNSFASPTHTLSSPETARTAPSRTCIVDANYRYIAAAQEVNARIAQRQQALSLYVSLVVSLLAAMVALGATGQEKRFPVEWLVLGFPVASAAFAFLNHKSERAITNLRRFLSELETLGDAHHSMPSYNTDPGWAQSANEARRFHDYAAGVLVLGGNGIGLMVLAALYPQRLAANPVPAIIAAAIAALSFFILIRTSKWSYRAE